LRIMNNKNENKDDIFKEAMQSSISSLIPSVKNQIVESNTTEEILVEQNLVEQALSLTIENQRSSWNKLKENLNGAYTEKAMRIMDSLPDREFIKVYLKLLEYVNPKIVRKEIVAASEEEKEITVKIIQNNNKIININSYEKEQ
jgi:hypothetical protein